MHAKYQRKVLKVFEKDDTEKPVRKLIVKTQNTGTSMSRIAPLFFQ